MLTTHTQFTGRSGSRADVLRIGAQVEHLQVFQAQAQVRFAVFEPREGGRRDHLDVQVELGRFVGQRAQQRRQHARHGFLGHDHREFTARGLRVESGLRAEHHLDAQQRLAHRFHQRYAARSELHFATHAHQQRIVEVFAQLVERGAHRGLRDEHTFGGARDVLLAQQGVECNQQVEIEAVELHAA